MGSWRRVGAFLGLVPDDSDRIADGEYAADYDEAYGSGYRSDYAAGYSDRPADNYDGGFAGATGGNVSTLDRGQRHNEIVTNGALAMQLQSAPQPAAESAAASRPVTVKLTGFGEARVVGERYRQGMSVILDMTDLTDSEARRVVDFAAGLAFAMRGSIDKVTTRVFMLLPPDADLTTEARLGLQGRYARR